MARKPRIQFARALYHVINRGNYRSDLFETTGAAQAFETALFEASEEMGWLLHAYTIMRNHFHLALETPRANLSQGIHWLASTFSTRFNRFRKENGHVFQGRPKALLIEPGISLARVVNYIHLNPVRAHVLPVEHLAQYQWSSYRRFLSKKRPTFLVCRDWLFELGLADTPEGWRDYELHLSGLMGDQAEQKQQGFDTCEAGWAFGSEEWRRDVARDHRNRLAELVLAGADEVELKHLRWTRALDSLLVKVGRTRDSAKREPKGARWKIDLARELRRTAGASIPWTAKELHMGSPASVRVYLSRVSA
jgi:putative transposase